MSFSKRFNLLVVVELESPLVFYWLVGAKKLSLHKSAAVPAVHAARYHNGHRHAHHRQAVETKEVFDEEEEEEEGNNRRKKSMAQPTPIFGLSQVELLDVLIPLASPQIAAAARVELTTKMSLLRHKSSSD